MFAVYSASAGFMPAAIQLAIDNFGLLFGRENQFKNALGGSVTQCAVENNYFGKFYGSDE
jgi:hypothetical protein